MMLALALLSFTSLADPVTGLKPGETVVVLDRALAFDSETIVRSRVLNAQTGEPLADVLVEAWTEDGSPPQGIAQCLDRMFSKRDGSIELDCVRPNYRGEKVRVSKAGFASAEMTLGDLRDSEIVLSPAWPLEGRVLDVAGKPVVGAIVRTRESCAHAVKASQTRTDAFGRFRLADCPTNDNGPEIEVLGERITPHGHLDAMDLRRRAALCGALEIYVAKRAPVDLRIIDQTGAPMAQRRLITREAPMYESWTNKDGICRMFPMESTRNNMYWICDTGAELTVIAYYLPTRVINVLPWPLEVERSLDARLDITFQGADADWPVPVPSFAADYGREFQVKDAESELPRGPGHILVGGRFDAYAQVDLPIELGPGVKQITIALTRNPLVRLKLPPDESVMMWVQVGDDSASDSAPTQVEKDFGFFVPPGQPITVAWERYEDAQFRRVQLPPITADAVADLTPDSTIVRPGFGDAAKLAGTLHFTVVDRAGKPIDGVEGRVYPEPADASSASIEKSSFTWTLPAWMTYRAAFSAPGYTSAWFQGSVPARGDAPVVRVVLQRRAHLSLTGSIANVIVPGSNAESVEGGFEFDVAPGPLMVRVMRPDADPLAIELTLAEGETRRLEVR